MLSCGLETLTYMDGIDVIAINGRGVRVETLYYYPTDNMFVDVDGWPIFNVHSMVRPSDIVIFKHRKDTMCIYDEDKAIVYQLLYPDQDLGWLG